MADDGVCEQGRLVEAPLPQAPAMQGHRHHQPVRADLWQPCPHHPPQQARQRDPAAVLERQHEAAHRIVVKRGGKYSGVTRPALLAWGADGSGRGRTRERSLASVASRGPGHHQIRPTGRTQSAMRSQRRAAKGTSRRKDEIDQRSEPFRHLHRCRLRRLMTRRKSDGPCATGSWASSRGGDAESPSSSDFLAPSPGLAPRSHGPAPKGPGLRPLPGR